MSYIVRYRLEFDDIHISHSSKWRVEIGVRDDSGVGGEISGVYEFTGAATPLIIIRGNQSDDKFEPIAGSEADISVIIQDGIPDGAAPYFTSPITPDNFITIDETQLQVNIYKDDVLYWTGYCKPDYCQYSYAPTPFAFTIVATDRIALLKSQLVDIQDEINGNGLVRLSDLVTSKGLYQTGVASQLKLWSSLKQPASTGVTYPGGSEKSFMDEIYFRYELFMDDNGYTKNIYDILTNIARSYSLRIFYSGGYFHLQRINDLFTESPLVSVFTNGTYPDSQSNVAVRKILKGEISSSDGIYANNNAAIEIQGGHKQETIAINYILRGYLLNYAWSSFGANGQTHDSFKSWDELIHQVSGTDLDGSAYFSQNGNGSQETPYTCFVKYFSAGTAYITQQVSDVSLGDIFSLKFDITFHGVKKCAYQVMVFGTTDDTSTTPGLSVQAYYDGVQWAYDVNNYKIGDPAYNNYVQRDSDLRKNTVTVNVELPKIQRITAYQGVDFISFTPTMIQIALIDPDVLVSDGTVSGSEGVEYGLITFGTQPNGYTGETDTHRSIANYSILNEDDDNIMIDGFDAFANSMRYGDKGVYNTDMGYWTDDFINDTIIAAYVNAQSGLTPITKAVLTASLQYEVYQLKNLRGEINQHRVAYKQLSTDVYSNTIEFEHIIQQAFGNFTLFLQMYDSYDVRNCIHTMQLLEVINPVDFTSIGSVKYKF